MASTDTTKKSVIKTVNSASGKQHIRARVSDIIKSKFGATLGQVHDITNIVMALIYKESGFNSENAKGPNYSRNHTDRIKSYSAIAKVFKGAGPLTKTNILNSAAAYGLCQVTGYYLIKGCGPGGKSELERMRPDLAPSLTVEPGTNVTSKLWGYNNIDNQIMAGLIVLEDKYKNIAPRLFASGRFPSRISAALGAYLGLSGTDSLGTDASSYSTDILRGSAYTIANDNRGPDGAPSVASGGSASSNGKTGSSPASTAASGESLTTAGC